MSKRQGDHMNLGDSLREFVNEYHLDKGLDKVNVAHAWENTMGQGVNSYTTAVELKNDVLYVSLSSSVLREELSYGSSKIIEMLNESLGKTLITKLVLR